MTLYDILCLCGVPSIIVFVFSRIMNNLHNRLEKSGNETNSLKLGVQALLRAQMINDYNRWSEKGYAPIYAKENFENMWNQYHNLGANGVMNNLHQKFLELPTKKN